MVRQRVSVIRDQQDQRVIVIALFFKCLKKLAQGIVHRGDLARVEALDVLDFVGASPDSAIPFRKTP